MRATGKIVFSLAALSVLVLAVIFGLRFAAQGSRPATTVPPQVSLNAPVTPADKRIQAAQNMIGQAPDKADGYNLLCAAYMQKARETGDFNFNSRAEAALARAFEVEPDNYDALKFRAKLLLTFHRFAEARTVALQALAQRPQDHDVYGALTDAAVELGDYPAAIEAAQKMVDLRPDTSSYARVSYLRALHGDTEGAIEAMVVAAKAADPRDPESVAWCYVQIGDELLNTGKSDKAELMFTRALDVFPDYHLALAAKGRGRVAAGDFDGALDFYRRAQQRVPLPETAIALGDLYTKLGRNAEAKQQYELVEFIERTGASAGTYSRLLALYYADHDSKLDEALAIARRERETRSDIFTCDALAWCLYKNGQFAEARTAIEEALRLKTRDARINYHAGMIYNALGEHVAAREHLKLAFAINPAFDLLQAEVAQRTIVSLKA